MTRYVISTVVGANKSFVSISFYAIRKHGFIIDDKNALSIRMVFLKSKIMRGYKFTLLFAQKQYQNKDTNMSQFVFLLQVAIMKNLLHSFAPMEREGVVQTPCPRGLAQD